jgi:hypothetical protein
MQHKIFHYFVSMKQNADHIHTQTRTYAQMLWPEELVAVTPDTILSTTGYIQNLLPVCPSFSFLSGLGSFHQLSHQTNNRYFSLYFTEELSD